MRHNLIPKTRYILRMVLSIPLLPYFFFLGRKIKADTPELPEAEENRTGSIGHDQKPLNLLCLGESSIAGVGVKDHRNGLAGVIARAIHQGSRKAVRWTVVARSGYTAKEVKENLVPEIPTQNFDVIVIGLGGNDTFKMSSPLQWRRSFIQLLTILRQKQSKAKIVIANMPPIKWFPAFPPLLRWLMAGQIQLLKKAIEDFPEKFEEVYFLKDSIQIERAQKEGQQRVRHRDLFSDGVHPSKIAYRVWGEQLAAFILEKVMARA